MNAGLFVNPGLFEPIPGFEELGIGPIIGSAGPDIELAGFEKGLENGLAGFPNDEPAGFPKDPWLGPTEWEKPEPIAGFENAPE